ncbi:MAG: GlmU family protein [Bacteroidales bacterium]|jgi:UDP-N-acetylglucosamine diphosphorylase/glucosamine-1-phosphate N-acetyltransferase|nr:GlmU family protein [Bacteroidales bacterium]
MNYVLFDDHNRRNLLPLVFMRPVADIRVGILTIREKWERYLNAKTSSLTDPYLSSLWPLVKEDDNIFINAAVLPNQELVDEIFKLPPDCALVKDDEIIAMRLLEDDIWEETSKSIETEIDFIKINYTYDIFHKNSEAIIEDFNLLTKGRKSASLSDTVRVINPENIFIEEGAKVEHAILNASNGPIYIGKDAEIMEGAVIRGPFALCDHGIVRMNAIIYGGTTVGPYCKVGGEIENSVLFAYSNKPHDGFMGHSVIAEWCNIAAGTITSNLNNTYLPARLWNYVQERFIQTNLQFCGLIMGDHSKTGINTMFNTGTVVGVFCNVFGSGYQKNFIPSFTWSGSGFAANTLVKALDTVKTMFMRREKELDKETEKVIITVYEITANNIRL